MLDLSVEVKQIGADNRVFYAQDAADPTRKEVAEAIANVLDKHGRSQEADNVRHSVNWKPMRPNPPYEAE